MCACGTSKPKTATPNFLTGDNLLDTLGNLLRKFHHLAKLIGRDIKDVILSPALE